MLPFFSAYFQPFIEKHVIDQSCRLSERPCLKQGRKWLTPSVRVEACLSACLSVSFWSPCSSSVVCCCDCWSDGFCHCGVCFPAPPSVLIFCLCPGFGRYHKSQAIYLESKDNQKLSCVIDLGTFQDLVSVTCSMPSLLSSMHYQVFNKLGWIVCGNVKHLFDLAVFTSQMFIISLV